MKINVTEVITNYDGSELVDPKTNEPVTLRKLISTALNSSVEGEPLVADDKARIYALSVKIWKEKEVKLTSKDKDFILERAGKAMTPIGYGRMVDLLQKTPAPSS